MRGRESFRGWLTISYLFAVLYAVIGAWGFLRYDQFLGGVALICALLYYLGSRMASEGNYRRARVMLILGGIPALPLGLLMIVAGVKIGKAAQRSTPYSMG